MDHTLNCNNLKCRRALVDRALVTTCSHIFCPECANHHGMTRQDTTRRQTCPACNSRLDHVDDAVMANLNPSEDYKTSILSGLSPNTIMECAGRALSFWAYQTTQDKCYQEHLYKTLASKYADLNIHFEKTMNEASCEVERVQDRLSSMASEYEMLRRRNEELAQAYREKTRKLLQTQELYDKVKQKAELSQIQRAAVHAVDSSIDQVGQLPHNYQSHEAHGRLPVDAVRQGPRFDSTGYGGGVSSANITSLADDARWNKPSLASRAHVSGTPMQNILGPRGGHPPVVASNGTYGYIGTPVNGSGKAIRPMNAVGIPNFAHRHTGLAGISLTSGMRASQPTSVLGLEAPIRGG